MMRGYRLLMLVVASSLGWGSLQPALADVGVGAAPAAGGDERPAGRQRQRHPDPDQAALTAPSKDQQFQAGPILLPGLIFLQKPGVTSPLPRTGSRGSPPL